jgi:hypothetical protein
MDPSKLIDCQISKKKKKNPKPLEHHNRLKPHNINSLHVMDTIHNYSAYEKIRRYRPLSGEINKKNQQTMSNIVIRT